jgi:chromosome segregation ATPase
LRRELEAARAETTASRGHATIAAAERADLERRLAAAQEELRSATRRADESEAEARAARDLLATAHDDNARAPSGSGDLDAARRQIEELTEQLRQARGAIERLRSLLGVFGLVGHLGEDDTGTRCPGSGSRSLPPPDRGVS